jgi:hypothetical protein
VPQEVAEAFATLHRVDVSAVPVHRGRGVDAQAAAIQAAAFTRGGEVFLPDALGPLTHSRTQAVLAHELTHAVQQRTGGSTASAATQAAATMEHAARWTERQFHQPARTFALPRLVHRRNEPPVPPAADPDPVISTTTSSPPADSPVQRITIDDLVPALAAPPPLPDVPVAMGDDADGWPDPPPAAAVPAELAELLANQDRLLELSATRPPDLDDPYSMDELAGTLFGRLRRLLRAELLLDRERAGRLADAS